MDTGVPMGRIGFMSIGMTRSIASGAEVRATGMGVRMVSGGCIGMALAPTSASGAAQHQTAAAAHTARRGDTRSERDERLPRR